MFIILNNDNCLEPDGTASQPAVEYEVTPKYVFDCDFNLLPEKWIFVRNRWHYSIFTLSVTPDNFIFWYCSREAFILPVAFNAFNHLTTEKQDTSETVDAPPTEEKTPTDETVTETQEEAPSEDKKDEAPSEDVKETPSEDKKEEEPEEPLQLGMKHLKWSVDLKKISRKQAVTNPLPDWQGQ